MAIVAVVTVPAAVIAAVLPFAVAALLAPARIGTRRPGMPVRRRVAQEVHRAAAGAVAGAVLAPVLGVARGHPHVDRRRSHGGRRNDDGALVQQRWRRRVADVHGAVDARSEEHTSELQSPDHLVCRLLLEKKKKTPEQLRLVVEM